MMETQSPMAVSFFGLICVGLVLLSIVVIIGVVVALLATRNSRHPAQFVCPDCGGKMMTGKPACPHCGSKFG